MQDGWTDVWQTDALMYDRLTKEHSDDQNETIILHYHCVAGYKKEVVDW